MNTIKTLSVASVIAMTFISSAWAVDSHEQVNTVPELIHGTTLKQKMDTVSAWGDSYIGMENNIASVARQKGATGYQIISERDFDEDIYGTAILYK